MQSIARSSEYAIRALTYLAQRPGEDFHLVSEMSEHLGIPAPFLSKILRPLVQRGLLESQRGRGGGFRLALSPSEVSLYQIVDSQENLGVARRCFLGQEECSDERACPMHEFWKAVSGDLLSKLAQTMLQDMVRFCEDRPSSGYPCPNPTSE